MKISYNDKGTTTFESLNIPYERFLELDYRMACIVHDILRPRRSDEELPHSGVLLKQFLALAENEQELAFVAFCAAKRTLEIYEADDIEEEEEEDYE